jgi:hypothetical protein
MLEREGDEATEETVHGGEGDPLGGGVADLQDSEEVTEGEPQQDR